MVCMMLYTFTPKSTQAWRDSLAGIVAMGGCRLEWINDRTAEVYMPVMMF